MPCQSWTVPSQATHCSMAITTDLSLSVLELHINGIFHYIHFSLWFLFLLNILFFRFMYMLCILVIHSFLLASIDLFNVIY